MLFANVSGGIKDAVGSSAMTCGEHRSNGWFAKFWFLAAEKKKEISHSEGLNLEKLASFGLEFSASDDVLYELKKRAKTNGRCELFF